MPGLSFVPAGLFVLARRKDITNPATFHSLGRYVSAGVKKKIGVQKMLVLKIKAQKDPLDLFLKKTLRVESGNFGAAFIY